MQRTVVITGASAGIGRALAFEFARRGYHLGLTARRLQVLETLRTELQTTYPQCKVEITTLDVDQDEHVAPVLHALFDALGGVDTVVVNAGINNFTRIGRGEFAKEKQVLQTNLFGAIATVNAAVEHFLERGKGQIVGISSLASLKGMPRQGAYCASKAGFSLYLDAARAELRRKNIQVTTVLPGFVVTDIMPDIAKYPFAASADKVAVEIVTATEKGKEVAIVPAFPWKWLRPLFALIPNSLWRKLI